MPAIYETVKPFYNGFAEISLGYNKIGIIDTTGKIVVPCIYSSISLVKDDCFFVVKDNAGKYGLYRNEHLVFDVIYDAIVYYSADTIAVNRDKTWRITNSTGTFKVFSEELKSYNNPKPDQVRFTPGFLSKRIFIHHYFGAHIFVDGIKKTTIETNEEIRTLQTKNRAIYYLSKYEEYARETHFIGFEFYNEQFDIIGLSDELSNIHRIISADDKYDFLIVEDDRYQCHLIDENFNYLRKLNYRVRNSFREDRAVVEFFINGKTKFGYISTTFEVVIEPIYDSADDFKNGFAKVKQGDKYGIIDIQGKIIIPIIYYKIGTISDGKCAVCLTPNISNSCCFINLDNQVISKTDYSFYYGGPYFNERFGIALVNRAGHGDGLIDRMGNEILDCKYLIESNYFGDGYAIIRKNDRYGILSATGEIVIPIEFKAIYSGFKWEKNIYWYVEDANSERGYINNVGTNFWE